MLSAQTLAMLRCPEDQSELAYASDAVVHQVNESIKNERLVNRGGKPVGHIIDAGLVRADGAWLYPVVDQIPILVRDDAISLNRLGELSP
jgi:uncharacterized protein YbaR (Trm112 family)